MENMYGIGILIVLVILSIRIVVEYKRGVVFTLGKYSRVLKPGINFIIPFIEWVKLVDIRERAVDVPSQEAMTKDNISCMINAVVYYKIQDGEVERSVININNLHYAMVQFAQTTMRNIVGQFELDEILTNRDKASAMIKTLVDEKSDDWGVKVVAVELKDVIIPDSLKRTIGKQAEAEREKRSKIITAQGEFEAAENLVKAAKMLHEAPGALHLRTLQSINDLSSDQSNTTIWMVPVEMMKAIEGLGKNDKL